MLIEIHMIQNHSPSNLNRDDLGAPKTCLFGGVTRARISSQCLKRSIRRSPEFHTVLEREGGVRTRRLITVLAERVHGDSHPPEKLIEFIAKAFEKGGVGRTGKGEEPNNTNILLFLPQSAIAGMADAVAAERAKRKPNPRALAEALADILGASASAPDIALSGRMTEVETAGLFARLELGVEASLSVAHAISTHAVTNEVDYFTAVDDEGRGTGAGHVDEAMFNSACFYKYFSLDWDGLVRNLAGREPDPQEDAAAHAKWKHELKPQAERLAAATLGHFLRAAALTTPTGKQNSFAAHNPPDGILVEVKRNSKTPVSYANAFADPVDPESLRGLVGQSVAQLGQYVHDIADGYDIEAERFWFSPSARHPLTWVERDTKAPEAEKPTVTPEEHNLKSLDTLVEVVVKAATGKPWSEVKDAGKASPEEA